MGESIILFVLYVSNCAYMKKKSESLMQELEWNSVGSPLYKSSNLSVVMALSCVTSEACGFKEAEINA